MFDSSKLAPAPWISWRLQQPISAGGKEVGNIATESGWSPLVAGDHCVYLDPDFAEFAALARNAWDVMMRRGWTVMQRFSDKWIVCSAKTGFKPSELTDWRQQEWPDPFTPLVEADRWYRENVENNE